MTIPKEYANYKCQDYFEADEYRREGSFDAFDNTFVVVPESQITINIEKDHMIIGLPGTDGIEFCYRKHEDGIWAYYPIVDEYVNVATDINALVRDWYRGKIKV